jgi:cellulose synthase/poly-beta-1,6-N-acetylglucosamine synthase-like glycosyltransferase
MAVYVVGLFYMLLFRWGYERKIPAPPTAKKLLGKLRTSVIVPIYNEEVSLIKDTLDSLANQKVITDLIVVVKDPRKDQLKLLKAYSRAFHSLKIVTQTGKPSQNEAFIEGLKYSKTKYTTILCSDTKIRDGYLGKMLAILEGSGKNAAFGLLYPEAKATLTGRFASMNKIFKQDLTLKGRAAMGLGWYIPGAFAVYRTALLKKEFGRFLKNRFVMQDYGLTLRLLASNYGTCYFIPEVVGTELEKSTFSGWLLQNMRWFIGNLGLKKEYYDLFAGATGRIKTGSVGLVILWWWFPVALFVGFAWAAVGVYFGLDFLVPLAAAYLAATIVLLTLPDIRRYGVLNCIIYWLIKSAINSLAIVSSVYGILFERYQTNKLYKMYKR